MSKLVFNKDVGKSQTEGPQLKVKTKALPSIPLEQWTQRLRFTIFNVYQQFFVFLLFSFFFFLLGFYGPSRLFHSF